MKFSIAKQTGIITLPEEFATLERVKNSGFYEYKFRYNIDVAKALRGKYYFVKIHISPRSPEYQDSVSLATLNSKELIANILQGDQKSREINRSFTQNYIVSLTSDITSRISNQNPRRLTSQEEAIFESKRFELVKNSTLVQENISEPSFQKTQFQPPKNSVVSVTNNKENAFSLIFEHGIDPAEIASETNSYIDSYRSYGGILNPLKGTAREAIKLTSEVGGAAQKKYGLLSSVFNSQRNIEGSDQLSRAPDDFSLVLTKNLTNKVTIEETLELPIGLTPDQFYVIFELKNSSDILAERIYKVVQHGKNLAILSLPEKEPYISVTSLDGYNRIEVKQLDPLAAGVFLYRRAFDSHSAITDAEYTQIGKIPLREEEGVKYFMDRFPSAKTVIYRVIAYNRAEQKAHNFSSFVLNKTTKISLKKQKRRVFLSVITSIVDRTIQVELSDLPVNVIAVRVYKQDLTKNQKLEDSELVGNTVFVQNNNGINSKFFVRDEAVVDNRSYKYNVLLVFRDGTEVWSTSSSEIFYNPTTRNILETRIDSLVTPKIGITTDVQFTIRTNILEGKLDQVKKVLEKQGLLSFFQQDIEDNKDKLQNLIGYHIIRKNIITGEVEDMGVFLDSNFSDQEVGKTRAVKPLQAAYTYEYMIITHFRNASTMIDTISKEVTNTRNPLLDYSFLPSKWEHPITLREGSIVSEASLLRNHAQTSFTFGTVGDITYVRVSLPDENPIIYDCVVRQQSGKKVLVQWKVNGSIKKIDHFLITREEMGMKTVIGRVHSQSESNFFQFVDTLSSRKDDHPKAFMYGITPILFDYNHGVLERTPLTVVSSRKE